jgi:hypothetical protein
VGIIYRTINKINGKMYVGSDLHNNPNYLGSGTLLQRALLKYGKENFFKETIETVENNDLLREREEFWLQHLQCADSDEYYNIVPNYLGGKTSSCFTKGSVPWNANKYGQCPSLQHMKNKKETEIYSVEALERRRLGRLKRSETLRQKASLMTDEERKTHYGRNKGKKLNRSK